MSDKNKEKMYNQAAEFLFRFFKTVWQYRWLIVILLLLFAPIAMAQTTRFTKKLNNKGVNEDVCLSPSNKEFFIQSAVMAADKYHQSAETEVQNALYVLEQLRSKKLMPYGFLPANLKTHEGEYAKTVLYQLSENPSVLEINQILDGLKRAIRLGAKCFEFYDFHKRQLEKIRNYARQIASIDDLSTARQIFEKIIALENTNFFLYEKNDFKQLMDLSERLKDKAAVIFYADKIIEKFDFYSDIALAHLVLIYGEISSEYYNKEQFLNYGERLASLTRLKNSFSWQAKAYYYAVRASLSTRDEANEIAEYALLFIENGISKFAKKKHISDYLLNLKRHFLLEVLQKIKTSAVTPEPYEVLESPRLKN